MRLYWSRYRGARPIAAALGAVLAVATFGGAARADDALYRSLGERPGLTRIVDRASALWLTDGRIKGQFDNVNMDRLRGRLVDQFCVLTGGPCTYTGRDMTATHKGLHLRNAEFNALAEDLQTAMEELSVSFPEQMRLLALLAPMQHQVVSQ